MSERDRDDPTRPLGGRKPKDPVPRDKENPNDRGG